MQKIRLLPNQYHYPNGSHVKILEILSKYGPTHRNKLVEILNLSLSSIRTNLTELKHEGKIEPVGRGIWKLTSKGD